MSTDELVEMIARICVLEFNHSQYIILFPTQEMKKSFHVDLKAKLDEVPKWLGVGIDRINQSEISMSTGTRIFIGINSMSLKGRSLNGAFIHKSFEHNEEVMYSLIPCIRTRGKSYTLFE